MGGRGWQQITWIARFIALAVALCLGCASAFAQQVPGIERIRFRTYTTAHGLPQATVRAIAQDTTGFLWFGTQDGLARFDGYGFKVYRHDRVDPWSLSANHVTALVADEDGSVWIGTQAGFNHYDPDLDRFTARFADPTRSDALASNNVTALALDSQRRLWVASTGGRLQWLDRANGVLHDSGMGERAPFRMVRTILELQDKSLLLGTLDGVWRIDPAAATMVEWRDADGASLDVYTLAQADDGSLWIGTAEAGLYRFSADGRQLAHYLRNEGEGDGSLHDNAVRALLFDHEGSLWVAGNGRGLARMDPASGRFDHHVHDAARPQTVGANRLWSLFLERHGLLIVGSWVNGFSVHDPRTRAFTLIDSVPGDARTLPARPVKTVHADRDGSLWMGTLEGGGLVHLDPSKGVLRRYVHDPKRADSLSHNFVQYVTRARNGGLWVATNGGGIDWMRPGGDSFEHIRHDPNDPDSLASDNVLSLVEGRDGTLWVGTADRGLDERCSGCKGFRHHVYDAARTGSIASDYVTIVYETRAGELWTGGPSGLGHYDRATDRFQSFQADRNDPRSLGADFITTIFEDGRGRLWAGTQGGGLNRLVSDAADRVHFEAIDTHAGLAADAAGAMVEDADGNLWASTTAGISRIDSNLHVVNFGRQDGAQDLGYWINSSARLPDGRIVFGGLGGATLFDPAKVMPPPMPAPLVTGLLVQNEPAKLQWQQVDAPLATSLWRGHAVSLAHDGSSVTFEFGALEYFAAESIRYAYQLEGHDRQWIETPSNRRLATYTDLPPGRYTMRVRARQSGAEWSEPSPAISVVVHPGFWESPLAYLMYVLMALATMALIAAQVRANLRRRHAVQESIRLSEERLKLALWGSGSEMWDLDLRSGHMRRDNQLQHLAVSHEASEHSLAGYRPFVHADDIQRFENAFATHLRGQSAAFEASYRTPNQAHEWVWVLTRGRVVERAADGHALRMSGTTSDSNALNQALAALRTLNEQLESRVELRTAAMQSANAELRNTLERLTLTQRQLLESEKLASLGGLVAGIAHEINTPLGIGVTAASHLQELARTLSRQFASGPVSDADLQAFEHGVREGADMILRNLRRADRLVRSFKQVAVDQSSEDRRVIDLGTTLDEILTTLGPRLKKTPHKIELDCAAGIIVETAPGALYQIVSNLVINSLTHAFADTSAGTIQLRAWREGETLCIECGDDGCGMDEAVRKRVFEPFFTTRRGQGGSGLGMHIVYNLVTQVLQGSIECDSAPGQGTRFLIRFPVSVVQA
ncbi:MAG: PAS domain-containing protein [Dokdonella sp.]|uniref:two-component regulator propeller domain-containing protein n=1 Tax=Dokdonella sp. TaxID=2291710 RepID=UPI0025C5157D|nr:two-component regulator propeller domain-containing protein [Dokdonella sp.]MBZ0222072.1 PAS domain-containing protein [Dokdonella sp.]